MRKSRSKSSKSTRTKQQSNGASRHHHQSSLRQITHVSTPTRSITPKHTTNITRVSTSLTPSRKTSSSVQTRRSVSVSPLLSQSTPQSLSFPLEQSIPAHRHFSTNKPQQSSKDHDDGDDDYPEPEIIKTSQPPKNKPTPIKPSTTPKKDKPPVAYNYMLPNIPIPPDGVRIFESNNKTRYQVALGSIYTTTFASGALTALGHINQWYDPTGIMFGVLSTAVCLGFSAKAFDVARRVVQYMYLMPDNTIEFETLGSFGLRRIYNYPANYIYPITADYRVHMGGIPIRFLPLPDHMQANPGKMDVKIHPRFYIHPASNHIGGIPRDAFDHLCLENTDFSIVKDKNHGFRTNKQSQFVDH